MAIFSAKAWFRAQLAPYLATIKKAVAGAAVGWPLLSKDPENPEPGQPWLLLANTVSPTPIALRMGFNHLVLIDTPAVESVVLCVTTPSGQIVRFAAASLE
jgi:hypothetical protein